MTESQAAEMLVWLEGSARLLGELRGVALLLGGFWFASQVLAMCGFLVNARMIARNGVP